MNSELKPTRVGRGRVYPASGLPGFASPELAVLAAELGEFHDRVVDQVRDLPDEAVNHVASGTQLSIGWVTTHLVAAEATWIANVSGRAVPSSIEEDPNYRRKTPYGEPPAGFAGAQALVDLVGTLFRQFTVPALQGIQTPDQRVSDSRLPTLRDVVRHLNWHWVFHSGHIGFMRLLWGSEYEWTFADDEP